MERSKAQREISRMVKTFKLRIGSYCYDLREQQLRNAAGELCKLRYQSIQVLHQLALRVNTLVSKRELFSTVWPDLCVTDDSLVQCIADIRRALVDNDHCLLQTFPRRGYLLVAQAQETKTLVQTVTEELSPFIGRELELQELHALLADPLCRLLTIVGMGGIGKSRLVKKLAKQWSADSTYSVCLVELAVLQDAAFIPQAIATSLGIAIQGIRTPLEQLQLALASLQLVLVLDNMEHLVAEESICQSLLEASPQLKIVVTSRRPLQVYGEWLYYLRGLSIPPNVSFYQSAAVLLFLQTARRISHDFSPTAQDQDAITAICYWTGGMPLGIEIAASWLRHLSCVEILAEIQARLATATQGAEPQTLNPTYPLVKIIQQTWQMLSPREQSILCGLSLFRGTFTRQAAVAITQAELEDFSSLIDKSLLSRDKDGYYVLHEVMRQYVAEQWPVAPTLQHTLVRRFVYYYVDMANALDASLGTQQLNSITQFQNEHTNFRECLRVCIRSTQTDLLQLGLELVGALGTFWFLANHWQEAYHWAERFLALDLDVSAGVKARALSAAGGIAVVLDQHAMAQSYLQNSIQLLEPLGPSQTLARSLAALGVLRRLQQRYLEAIQCGQRSIRLFTLLQDEGGCQFNWVNIGHSFLCLGQYEQGVAALEQCISLNQRVGLTLSMPYALVNLGRLHWKLLQFGLARAYLQQSITLSEQLGILLYRAQALCILGWVELAEGQVQQALLWLRASLADYIQLGDREGQADVLFGISIAKTLLHDKPLAWQCITVADHIIQQWQISNTANNHALLGAARQTLQQTLSDDEQVLYRNLGLTSSLETLLASV